MEIPIDKTMQDLSVKKKILHIVGAFNIGGAETMLINILRYIDKSRYHIDLAVSGSEEGFYEAEAGRLGSRIYHVPKRSESFIGHLTELNKLIKKERYDIVHINTQNAFFSSLELAITLLKAPSSSRIFDLMFVAMYLMTSSLIL